MSSSTSQDRSDERIVERPLAIAAPFSRLAAANGVAVELAVGTEPSVTVVAAADSVELARVTVADGLLTVTRALPTPPVPWRPITVRVVAPRCERLEAREGASIAATGLGSASGAALAIEAASGGRLDVSLVGGHELRVAAADGTAVELKGSAATLVAALSNGAALRAAALEVEQAEVSATAGAFAELGAREAVRGSVTLGAHVRLVHRPRQVDVKVDTGGFVT